MRERRAKGLQSRGDSWCLERAMSRGVEPTDFPGF